MNIFSGESPWSEFKIPEPKSISAFVSNNTIVVISSEGIYYVATFNPRLPGKCIKNEEVSLNLNPNIY